MHKMIKTLKIINIIDPKNEGPESNLVRMALTGSEEWKPEQKRRFERLHVILSRILLYINIKIVDGYNLYILPLFPFLL